MSPAKKAAPPPQGPEPLWRLLAFLVGPGRTATIIVLLAGAFAAGAVALWRWVGPRVQSHYTIHEEDISVTPPPVWIHPPTDVRKEAFRIACPADRPLSSLDDDLVERIAHAFSLHPWVKQVVRARKLAPARVSVELEYRQPVCVVEVAGDLLPVDIDAVCLPNGDFTPVEKQAYPCVSGITTRPMGTVGQSWGDRQVYDAARIAATLHPVWQQLRLWRIRPCQPAGTAPADLTYELLTVGQTRIHWHHAPTVQVEGECPLAEKVARLVRYANEHGTLEGRTGPQQLDIESLPAEKK